MPSIAGYTDEELLEFIDEELIEDGEYESRSEVVYMALRYLAYNKHGFRR